MSNISPPQFRWVTEGEDTLTSMLLFVRGCSIPYHSETYRAHQKPKSSHLPGGLAVSHCSRTGPAYSSYHLSASTCTFTSHRNNNGIVRISHPASTHMMTNLSVPMHKVMEQYRANTWVHLHSDLWIRLLMYQSHSDCTSWYYLVIYNARQYFMFDTE